MRVVPRCVWRGGGGLSHEEQEEVVVGEPRRWRLVVERIAEEEGEERRSTDIY